MSNKIVICGINTATLPHLSEQQSMLLMDKAKGGDQKAREDFIIANMRLVLSITKRFNIKNVTCDDVFQAGCIGLVKAMDNFDISVGVKFSTYAVPLIIGEIKRLLREGNSLRVARSIRDTAYQVLKTRSELEKQDKDASLENIASTMNTPLSEVVYALDAISDTVSIYEPVYNKAGDTLLLMDQLGDSKCTEDNWTEKVAIDVAMNKLCDRERKIIYLRYFEGKTQTEISNEIGISQAQVSRLEKNALREIKERIRV